MNFAVRLSKEKRHLKNTIVSRWIGLSSLMKMLLNCMSLGKREQECIKPIQA